MTHYRNPYPHPAPSAIAPSCVAVPVVQICEVVVPAADRGLELAGDRRDLRPGDHRDDRLVGAPQVVHADEQGRALDRVELALGGAHRLVVVLAAPACDVAPLPLVLPG